MLSFLREFAELGRFFFGLHEKERSLVFYVEHRGYLPYVEGFVREVLGQSSLTVCYLTSDPSDAGPPQAGGRVKIFRFKRLLPFVILFLDAKVLVMTLPDLHRYYLRRSVRGTCHVYVFHAMVSTHMIYRFGAFDHYDVIFCAGPHQVSELLRAEQIYRTPQKRLLEVGYPPLDQLLKARSSPPVPAGRRVLIAPSWGADNILESCASELIRSLLDSGFKAVVRPHPEWIRRHPDELARLRRTWPEETGVEWAFGPLTDQTLLQADALVTDWSGVALEYAFGTERPVLFLDVPRKIHNPRYEELGLAPLEVHLRDRIGKVVPLEGIARIGDEVRQLIDHPEAHRDRIIQERARAVFHLGESGKVGARFLLELCRAV